MAEKAEIAGANYWTRGGIRVKKNFREFLTDGAFSRNENVINREWHTRVSVTQILPRVKNAKIFPMAFFMNEIRWTIFARFIFYGSDIFDRNCTRSERVETSVLRTAEFQFSS